MKFFNILLFVLISSCSLSAQKKMIDLVISASYSPSTIYIGDTTLLNVKIANIGLDELTEPEYSWVNIVLPANVLYMLEPRIDTGNWFQYFEINQYDPNEYGLLYLLNKSPLPSVYDYTEIDFYIPVVGIGENGSGLTTAATLGLEIVAEQNGYEEDREANNSSCGVEVLTPLPVTLASFYGSTRECGIIDLRWVTVSENNNAYFEVQRSRDGRNFETVGKIIGSNHRTGKTYSFTDESKELVSGVKYYYRLNQVDLDGKSTIHKVTTVDYRCIGAEAELDIYPNPAVESINILLTNLDPEVTYKAVIINGEGAEVKFIDINSGTPYNFEVKDMPEGIYNIRILDQSDKLTKNFIRIR